jgi:exodeoxyribonuclease V beta subunit
LGSTQVIEASAGTGKTWMMSNMAARFVAEAGIPIHQIAMVTFSRASTTEAKERTQSSLVTSVTNLGAELPPIFDDGLWSDDPVVRHLRRKRLLKGIEDFDRAPIMTLHGFCEHLLDMLGIHADHDSCDQLRPDLDDLIINYAIDDSIFASHSS